ncbi:MAG TPA: retropepsin-like aspartic protease [Terracidiphilus sp.]|jgi:hypothetical protein
MRHFAFLFFAALIPGSLVAEMGCPANVKAIPIHKINQRQMVVGVSINHSGPYDFLLDTGTQMTVVDLSLAADLQLTATGNANVAGVSFQGPALYAELGRLQVGDHVTTKQGVLVYNMKNVQRAGFAVRGLLGEDFLSRFDVLINNSDNVLCIDDTGAMLERINAKRAPIGSAAGTARRPSHITAEP